MTEVELLTEVSVKLSDLYLLGCVTAAAVLVALGYIAGHQR